MQEGYAFICEFKMDLFFLPVFSFLYFQAIEKQDKYTDQENDPQVYIWVWLLSW